MYVKFGAEALSQTCGTDDPIQIGACSEEAIALAAAKKIPVPQKSNMLCICM